MNKKTAEELTKRLKGLGYKNFTIHTAEQVGDDEYIAIMTVRERENTNKVKIDLRYVDNRFTTIEKIENHKI